MSMTICNMTPVKSPCSSLSLCNKNILTVTNIRRSSAQFQHLMLLYLQEMAFQALLKTPSKGSPYFSSSSYSTQHSMFNLAWKVLWFMGQNIPRTVHYDSQIAQLLHDMLAWAMNPAITHTLKDTGTTYEASHISGRVISLGPFSTMLSPLTHPLKSEEEDSLL